MKPFLITLTFLLSTFISMAQELKVKSFIHNEMNLEARVGGGRTDLNGRQCALIKVVIRDNILKCRGGNIGDIVTEGVVKRIFVTPSTRFLEFEFQYNFPLKVTFADYGFNTLEEGCTYTLTLVDANTPAPQPLPQSPPATPIVNTPSQPVQQNTSSSVLPIEVKGISFNMVRVEGGTFDMGATPEQVNPEDDEKPVHQVTLSSYYIGETEVTQALWQAVMGKNPSKFKGDNLPIEYVSWDDCQKFIKKLNKITHRNFRLPTEAEWEFAARGGNRSRHTQYSGSDHPDEVAWYDDNSSSKTHPVKTKKANELGIYDMSGNVWEWCQDKYDKYDSTPQNNPTGPDSGTGRVNRGVSAFAFASVVVSSPRVLRGGSWDYSDGGCRLSLRKRYSSEYTDYNLGLRLVLSE